MNDALLIKQYDPTEEVTANSVPADLTQPPNAEESSAPVCRPSTDQIIVESISKPPQTRTDNKTEEE